MKNFLYIVITLSFLTFYSCKKDDGPYTVTKEITVKAFLDSGGTVPYVKFVLFDSHEDWRKDSNPIVVARTGSNGEFIYEDENFQFEKKYYFNLGVDLSNNWIATKNNKISDESYSFVFPKEPRRVRKDITVGLQTGAVISETYYDIFVGDSLKSVWSLHEVTINGIIQDWNNVDSCLKDNQLIFYKDFEVEIFEGKAVCSDNKPRIFSQYVPATPNDLFIEILNWPKLNDHHGQVNLLQNLSEIAVEFNINGVIHVHFYKKN